MAKKPRPKTKTPPYTTGTPPSKYDPTPDGKHPTKGYIVCGAKKKSGKQCMAVAGLGTTHLGQGKCKFHGGARPIKHGIYSRLETQRLRDLINEMKEEDPLNLMDDLVVIRALAVDFINRYEKFTEALINWNDSWKTGDPKHHKPSRVLDISFAAQLVSQATKVVKMIHDMRASNSITMKTFRRLMEQMAMVVARNVRDGATLRAIEKEWGLIQVDSESSGVRPAERTRAARAIESRKSSQGEIVH